MSQSDSSAGEQSEKQKKVRSVPHLINLNEDPMLSRVIFHFLEQSKCIFVPQYEQVISLYHTPYSEESSYL